VLAGLQEEDEEDAELIEMVKSQGKKTSEMNVEVWRTFCDDVVVLRLRVGGR
jgi:hypothetical protein